MGRLATVATTDHAGLVTGVPQQLHQLRHQRRLTRTADTDIADHDDRHAQTHAFQDIVSIQKTSHPRHQPEQQTERPKQYRDQIQRISVTVEPVHDQGFGDGETAGLVVRSGDGFGSPAVVIAS